MSLDKIIQWKSGKSPKGYTVQWESQKTQYNIRHIHYEKTSRPKKKMTGTFQQDNTFSREKSLYQGFIFQ